MIDEVTFFDTNILVYAYDSSAGEEHAVARSRLEQAWLSRHGRCSVQVLVEFYVVVTRKLAKPLPLMEARQIAESLGSWKPVPVDAYLMTKSWKIQDAHGLSYWDCQIIAAAMASGATRVLTEDLQHDMRIGALRVVNPFAPQE